MKHVLLAIFVLLGTQPLPALGCDLHADRSPAVTEHQHMASQDMSDMADMDCCDDDSAQQADHCTSMNQCGTCAPGLTALIAYVPTLGPATNHLQAILDQDKNAHLYYVPLFRPPIS